MSVIAFAGIAKRLLHWLRLYRSIRRSSRLVAELASAQRSMHPMAEMDKSVVKTTPDMKGDWCRLSISSQMVDH